MKIVIAGGSGQIGTNLVGHMRARGDQVITLGRSAKPEDKDHLVWDGRTLDHWATCVDGADAVINLAGRTVNCRYDGRNRTDIYFSRIDSTRVLGEAIAQCNHPPRVWLNASTATIYRHALDRPQDEIDGEIWHGDEEGVPDKWHFSVDVARRWEATFFRAHTPQTRRVALRASMVMDPLPGGVFAVLSRLIRCGLGGAQGGGKQRVSWIHIEDFMAAIDHLLERDDAEGIINICAPNPLPNRAFMKAIRQACGVPLGLPAFGWMLAIGAWAMRTETELLLKSRWVVPTRLEGLGFTFKHPHWPEAAKDLMRQMKAARD
jgi:uncharacterized protein (TIGR01777 family)